MTTIDIALTNVDINQCNKESGGQFQFEIFAGTHRCKNKTTQVRLVIGIRLSPQFLKDLFKEQLIALEAWWPNG